MAGSLKAASTKDIVELMSWFPDARSVDVWGGPEFRYPFTTDTFREDCRWHDFATYILWDSHQGVQAFGQLGERYQRAHLARLIVNPLRRGQGIGRGLVEALLQEAKTAFSHRECGLFVYRDNTPAASCYRALGFEVQPYPADAPMPERCLYLSKAL